MSLIVEDGTGLATSNSYVTVDEANTYFTARGNTVWADVATTDLKQGALIRATDYIETRWGQRFKGAFEFPETPQALSFPRINLRDKQGTLITGIPVNLKRAVFEYALKALSDTLFLEPVLDDTGMSLIKKRTKTGLVEKEVAYAVGSSPSTIKPIASADLLIQPYIASGRQAIR